VGAKGLENSAIPKETPSSYQKLTPNPTLSMDEQRLIAAFRQLSEHQQSQLFAQLEGGDTRTCDRQAGIDQKH
jgi:hypothetical protein